MLGREERGLEAFTRMVTTWIERNEGISFQAMADLAEHVVRFRLAPDVPQAEARSYEPGELMVHGGHVWRCRSAIELQEVNGVLIGPRFKAVRKGDQHWEHVAMIRRIQASQLNGITLGRMREGSPRLFDTLGMLNEWLSDLRDGKVPPPADPQLAEKAAKMLILEDEEGPLGAEELFAVYIGKMTPPTDSLGLTDQQALQVSRSLSRRIREAMTAAGLDIVDDWGTFASLYPTNSKARLNMVRSVVMGAENWGADRVLDEEVAVAIAISRLEALRQKALA